MSLFLLASDDPTTGLEPYLYNSETGVLAPLGDLTPGPDWGFSSAPVSFYRLGTSFLFTGVDPAYGAELWISDGTTFGTRLLLDVAAGLRSSNPSDLTVNGPVAFFSASTLGQGAELWVTDGTASGTHIVSDLVTGTGGSAPDILGAYRAGVVFTTEALGGIWISDGATTTQLTPAGEGFGYPELAVSGRSMIFTRLREPQELWFSDGTTSGTRAIVTHAGRPEINDIRTVASVGSTFFFVAETDLGTTELWTVDRAGTVRGSIASFGSDYLTIIGTGSGLLYFSLNSGDGGLWRSDGTTAGTFMISDFPSSTVVFSGMAYDGQFLFSTGVSGGHDQTLWLTDGTQGGTKAIRTAPLQQLIAVDHGSLIVSAANAMQRINLQGDVLSTTTGGSYTAFTESFAVQRVGTDVAETLVGGIDHDRLEARGGADVLDGRGGADTLLGGDGPDTLKGGSGDDLIDGGASDDVLGGAAGRDVVSYAWASAGVRVDLAVEARQDTGGGGADALQSIEGAVGGAANDLLYGTTAGNDFRGGAGNDRLEGRDGRDQLRGQDGADTLVGGSGADRLWGGDGQDVFLYLIATDSGSGKSNRDAILDFDALTDTLDLSGIDAKPLSVENDSFTWVHRFSGHSGELTVTVRARYALVEADLDGDANTDFSVRLEGVSSFPDGSLVL
jgi:ELWxxDGT repeat protein